MREPSVSMPKELRFLVDSLATFNFLNKKVTLEKIYELVAEKTDHHISTFSTPEIFASEYTACQHKSFVKASTELEDLKDADDCISQGDSIGALSILKVKHPTPGKIPKRGPFGLPYIIFFINFTSCEINETFI